jgi:hypothetical protein
MRYLSSYELREIASYVYGTRANLRHALSELGFDPDEYPKIRQWLAQEVGVVQSRDTHLWHLREE